MEEEYDDFEERYEDYTFFDQYSCVKCGTDTWKRGIDLPDSRTICHDCNKK